MPEQVGEPIPETEKERLTRLAFIAGAEFMKDSIRRTRHGQLSHAGSPMVVGAAIDYSREAK